MSAVDTNDVRVLLDDALRPLTTEMTIIKTALVGIDGQDGLIKEHKEVCEQVRKNTTNIKLMLLAMVGAGLLGGGVGDLLSKFIGG
jgi:hypothetical protein